MELVVISVLIIFAVIILFFVLRKSSHPTPEPATSDFVWLDKEVNRFSTAALAYFIFIECKKHNIDLATRASLERQYGIEYSSPVFEVSSCLMQRNISVNQLNNHIRKKYLLDAQISNVDALSKKLLREMEQKAVAILRVVI